MVWDVSVLVRKGVEQGDRWYFGSSGIPEISRGFDVKGVRFPLVLNQIDVPRHLEVLGFSQAG